VAGGRLVSHTGRYKKILLTGLVLASTAYALLSLAAMRHVSPTIFEAFLVMLGAGMGLVMPNMTTAIQNAVAVSDLGVATAAQNFFRSLGAAFGVALSGALLTGTLKARLPSVRGASVLHMGLDQMRHLAPAEQLPLMAAYSTALATIFGVSALIVAIALAVASRIPERPLRGRSATPA
jgi:MFS family permease